MQKYINSYAMLLNKTVLLAKLEHSDMTVLDAKYVSLKTYVSLIFDQSSTLNLT